MNDRSPPPLDLVPHPTAVHRKMGDLLRQLAILRRQYRISKAAYDESSREQASRLDKREPVHAG